MIESFEADMCSVMNIDDLNAFVIVLANNADLSLNCLELQKSLSNDDQDYELGMDTYCIVTSTGATFYGGITACVLSHARLSIRLSLEATNALGVSGFDIALLISSGEKEQLKGGLIKLFDGSNQQPENLVL
jgi:Immunity protein 10